MPRPLSFGEIRIGLTDDQPTPGAVPERGTPLRIAVLGDFSGRGDDARPRPDLGDRPALRVDADNVDSLPARYGVELRLPQGADDPAPLTVRIGELDDFHPDRLFRQVDRFQELRDLRRRLADRATFAAAAAELGRQAAAGAPPPAQAPPPSNTADLLEHMLGGTPAATPPPKPPAAPPGWQAFLQKLVEPHRVARIDESKQAELIAAVDEVMSAQMRAVLHHPRFQAAEALWRGLRFLVRRLDPDATLQLHALDVSKADLVHDLSATEDLRATGTYRLLVERTVGTRGGQPWGVLLGHYTFGPTREDVEVLGRLAKLAGQAGAPVLAGASPHFLGVESLADRPDPDDWQPLADADSREAWSALRHLPEAAGLGLALPRLLLRMPYGRESDPVEQFDFEEMAGAVAHDRCLWGNAAVACVCLLGRAFRRLGWQMGREIGTELDGLPLYVYQHEGETQAEPCAEAWLTDRAAGALLDLGLVPLVSVQGRDAVFVPRIQSVGEPPARLAGRWED
jgi:type VI secretion system protein ImpC